MKYLFVPSANYQDFASGHVIRSRPGMPAFPVRLASELFLRAVSYLDKEGNTPPYHIYDPVCGGGFSLTVIGFLHRSFISRLTASDIDSSFVSLALSNLTLLTARGLDLRLNELTELASKYKRQSHDDAIQSLMRLRNELSVPFQASDIHVFEANALDTRSMHQRLPTAKIDIVFADIPYGNCTHWSGTGQDSSEQLSANGLLTTLSKLESVPKIIILATSKHEKPKHSDFHRITMLQNGSRRISIFSEIQ